MARAKIAIPKTELKRLYLKERWSPAKIGSKFGCNAITVRNRLIEAGIPLKSKSEAQTRYQRKSFSGSPASKAYMLGFRYGDLNVYQPKGASKTIVVRSHSTHLVQGNLFKELFSKFGMITVSVGKQSTQMNCYLDLSFSFLLDKYPSEIQKWLHSENSLQWAFVAGYVDAEGTFGLNQGRGRFKIDAYDQEILFDMHALLQRSGIESKLSVIAKKGENDYGWEWKHDLWRLSVNRAGSLERLIRSLMPYLRHEKRVSDANMVLLNIQQRRLNGTIP